MVLTLSYSSAPLATTPSMYNCESQQDARMVARARRAGVVLVVVAAAVMLCVRERGHGCLQYKVVCCGAGECPVMCAHTSLALLSMV